jgi:hypothetical protein
MRMKMRSALEGTSLVLAIVLCFAPAAEASPEAKINQCWGDISNQMGTLGLMGVHSAASSPFNATPEDPRVGVANQGRKINAGEPGEGGNGIHAIMVGSLAFNENSGTGVLVDKDGQPVTSDLTCTGTSGNPGPAALP